jgi:hypothetical protein
MSHHGNSYRLDAGVHERCCAFVAKRWNRSPAFNAEWPNIRMAPMGGPSLAGQRHRVKAQQLSRLKSWATIVGEPDMAKPQDRFDEGTTPKGLLLYRLRGLRAGMKGVGRWSDTRSPSFAV